MIEVAGIVKSLTKAQREAIRNASYGHAGFDRTRLYHAGQDRTGKALYLRKLVTFGGALTETGLAVRSALAKENDRGE